MSALSERLATLAERFSGAPEDGDMILDRLAYTTIAAVLMDFADDAAVLEQHAKAKAPQPMPVKLTDVSVVDLASHRMARALSAPTTPNNAA